MQAETRRKRGRIQTEDASDRVREEHAQNRGRPEALVGGAGDHQGVEQGASMPHPACQRVADASVRVLL